MASGTVVITGASSGIGEASALHLRSLGFDVLAGVRSNEDAERIRERGLDRLAPLMLDVTNADSIAAAAAEVESLAAADGLAGLVNNAGIAVASPLEFVPIDELRRQLEVNVIGQVAVTQAFLPLLRIAQGRVINMSSIGGRMAVPLVGAYAASKFALEGLTDSLRREVRGQGVEVVAIEPGGIRTAIWPKGAQTAEAILERLPPDAEQLYGAQIETMRAYTRRIAEERGLPVSMVAEAVGAALTAPRPRTRYVVGGEARVRAVLARVLPDRALDWLIAAAMKRRG